jgi:hypothetical protein
MARPLVQLNSTGPDVMDAILRLNLSGADPQVLPSETFDVSAQAATEIFQANHGLAVDGKIGTNTWDLLDQLDGGRLVPAAGIAAVTAARDARVLRLAPDSSPPPRLCLTPSTRRTTCHPKFVPRLWPTSAGRNTGSATLTLHGACTWNTWRSCTCSGASHERPATRSRGCETSISATVPVFPRPTRTRSTYRLTVRRPTED